MWETDKVAQNTSYSRCRWFNKLLNHVLSFSQDWMTVLYQENVFKYSQIICFCDPIINRLRVCVYVPDRSVIHWLWSLFRVMWTQIWGGEKKNKMIRRRMKRITRSCWIAHRDRIHPCETHWQLVSMETTQHRDKARMLATEIKMIKRRLWIKHGGIKEEISR